MAIGTMEPPRALPLLRRRRGPGDAGFSWLLRGVTFVFVAVLAGILISLIVQSRSAVAHNGLGFITSTRWDAAHVHYGVLSMIVGTLETTVIALVLAVPLGMATAIALAEYLPHRLAAILGPAVELLAAVPSVVFGLWGFLVVAPWFSHSLENRLQSWFSWTGLFNGAPIGVGLLLAGTILAIMILPTMASISRDVIAAIPATTVEAATGLGATRWQGIARVVLPNARAGLLGGAVLAAARALGETIAVTMVIGNTNSISHSLLGTGQTLASLIANEFTEATEQFHLASLIEAGLLLLIISVLVNTGARMLVRRVGRQSVGVGVL